MHILGRLLPNLRRSVDRLRDLPVHIGSIALSSIVLSAATIQVACTGWQSTIHIRRHV